AEARLLTRERSLTIGREWLRTEQINFDLGFGDAQNLIAAVQSALELEAAHLEAIRNHNVSVLRLLNATGILVSHVRTAGFL
ncbi:MAG: TolC family protein, partial [Rhodothermales bacterium]